MKITRGINVRFLNLYKCLLEYERLLIVKLSGPCRDLSQERGSGGGGS